ncbi:hypothetical protein B0H15DRAFT_947252 [Mycena belliarum]|uniref:Clp1-like protein n=1 Tax=Mycena belliarum TaxID=1033014 RepID=A0AAD6U7E4_9AGAR|nr:hypothetical protein B0H15DRAFT_947252 [Mycena belliae]
MVLQSKRVNLENAPPSFGAAHPTHGSIKSIGSRIRSSIHDPARRRRARTAHSSKYAADQTKRKSKAKAPQLRFDVTSVAPPQMADVEMCDVEQQPAFSTTSYEVPRELLRPTFQEISYDTLSSFEPELLGDDLPDIEYIRDVMEDLGPGLLRAAVTVVPDSPAKNALPTEIAITINDHSDYPPPTHMLAVHGRAPKDAPLSARRQVTLVPTHSLVLGLHCVRLPKFAAPPSAPAYTSEDRTQLTIPVQPLCIPAPATYAFLATFLYTKRTDILLKALLPCPPPPKLDDDRTLLPAFAGRLAATYTGHALMRHIQSVYGLWQNACALGVFVDELWDTIDLAWEVLLTAMAISNGKPHLMLKRPATPPPVASTSEVAASTADSESRASTPQP